MPSNEKAQVRYVDITIKNEAMMNSEEQSLQKPIFR